MDFNNLNGQQVAARAWDIYDRNIRAELDSQMAGKFLVIDVETGCFETADRDIDAVDRARARNPEGVFYLMRIGSRVVGSIGHHRGAQNE